MEINNHKIEDYDKILDARFGKEGSPERAAAEDAAAAFYTGQIILDARKESKVTQQELAEKMHVSKSYISRIEKGIEKGMINPSVATFYRIMNALGLRVEIVRPIA